MASGQFGISKQQMASATTEENNLQNNIHTNSMWLDTTQTADFAASVQ